MARQDRDGCRRSARPARASRQCAASWCSGPRGGRRWCRRMSRVSASRGCREDRAARGTPREHRPGAAVQQEDRIGGGGDDDPRAAPASARARTAPGRRAFHAQPPLRASIRPTMPSTVPTYSAESSRASGAADVAGPQRPDDAAVMQPGARRPARPGSARRRRSGRPTPGDRWPTGLRQPPRPDRRAGGAVQQRDPVVGEGEADDVFGQRGGAADAARGGHAPHRLGVGGEEIGVAGARAAAQVGGPGALLQGGAFRATRCSRTR